MRWADLEDGSDAPWHIDPKDTDPATEEDRQRVFLADMRKFAPRVIVWAVPNAGRRTAWEAGKAKREGLISGALDLTIVWNHGVVFAEFKSGTTMPTANQRAMLSRLYGAGQRCGVFRSSKSLLAFLSAAGAPVGGFLGDHARVDAHAVSRLCQNGLNAVCGPSSEGSKKWLG